MRKQDRQSNQEKMQEKVQRQLRNAPRQYSLATPQPPPEQPETLAPVEPTPSGEGGWLPEAAAAAPDTHATRRRRSPDDVDEDALEREG